jgi:hypothetical protein
MLGIQESKKKVVEAHKVHVQGHPLLLIFGEKGSRGKKKQPKVVEWPLFLN